ncbi:TetR/AcrR family transcriptional regulator [Oceanobacillus saliphilus]|uniref:TetR/AcrR family transcriptional regulator n=1 Tax=Oceanobacillus saliphilus TaxID=2925834 RepID=UPI00201E4BC1|nr:TetR family transcriptional regulator [Oceanobacillus saliphilus]
MPKQTFFNLPVHKRKTLMKAAEKEFARVPLSKASIASIIRTAEIPRGSFYQYFENKEDLYYYILGEQTKERKLNLISLLKKHNGDIIEATIDMYYDFLVQMPDEEEQNFLKNAMLHVTHKVENVFTDLFNPGESEQLKEITALINKEYLNIKEDKDLFHIMQIVTAVAFRNFVEKFSKELSDEEALESFTIEMNLLKNGLYKRE